LAQNLLLAKTMPGAVAQEVCQWQKYNIRGFFATNPFIYPIIPN